MADDGNKYGEKDKKLMFIKISNHERGVYFNINF
jgi:hypothetical protein